VAWGHAVAARRSRSSSSARSAAGAPAALPCITRVAPAATDAGLVTVYRWTATDDGLHLSVSVTPDGEWPCPLPRLGVRLGLPAAYGEVTWAGLGPGEAYPDTRTAAMAGRWTMPVDALQTPYVYPQENGARAGVRWAELRTEQGGGLRIEGGPEDWLTARRWTTEQLAAARHHSELTPGDTVWLHLDHALHGIGSRSCGPGVLPQYELHAEPAGFAFTFRILADR
jgi:beta-galactosidase